LSGALLIRYILQPLPSAPLLSQLLFPMLLALLAVRPPSVLSLSKHQEFETIKVPPFAYDLGWSRGILLSIWCTYRVVNKLSSKSVSQLN
jgi:hypothetical protein